MYMYVVAGAYERQSRNFTAHKLLVVATVVFHLFEQTHDIDCTTATIKL